MKRHLGLLLAGALSFLVAGCGVGQVGSDSQSTQSAVISGPASAYWGLRNLQPKFPIAEEQQYGAHYVAASVRWSDLEPAPGTFSWSSLDTALKQVEDLGGQAILVVDCDSPWATSGKVDDGNTAPTDLDRATPLHTTTLSAPGYSKSLYWFTRAYVKRILGSKLHGMPPLLRWQNEPAGHWSASVADVGARGIDDYLRTLRTFALAAHDEARAEGKTVLVSHGGMNYESFLFTHWYGNGTDATNLVYFKSFWERWNPGQPTDWADVKDMMGRGQNRVAQAWTQAFVQASAWIDFHDVHYHFKPRYLPEVMSIFRARATMLGLPDHPWYACEEAMREADGFNDYRFQAGDMARKWILGLASGLTGFATPIIGTDDGSDTSDWIGLYENDRLTPKPLPSATSYLFLRGHISGEKRPRDLSRGDIRHYRFYGPTVDVIWREALFDAETTTEGVGVCPPVAGASEANGLDAAPASSDPKALHCNPSPVSTNSTLHDVLGVALRKIAPGKPVTLVVGQEPQIITWGQ